MLGKDLKIEFCKFLKGIKFPDGYAANLGRYISEDGWKDENTFLPHTPAKNHTCRPKRSSEEGGIRSNCRAWDLLQGTMQ